MSPSLQHFNSDAPTGEASSRCAIIFVGNKLMLDEGIGPAAFDVLVSQYDIPENVSCFDVGCMSLDMINVVRDYDFIVTVDAVDGTNEPAGTVFRFAPEDVARHSFAMASLHDLKLIDLFDSAALLGFESEGVCLGMQVFNMYPVEYSIGLTRPVHEKLPLLIETIRAELFKNGYDVHLKDGQTLDLSCITVFEV